jgi:hypothetical protein
MEAPEERSGQAVQNPAKTPKIAAAGHPGELAQSL